MESTIPAGLVSLMLSNFARLTQKLFIPLFDECFYLHFSDLFKLGASVHPRRECEIKKDAEPRFVGFSCINEAYD